MRESAIHLGLLRVWVLRGSEEGSRDFAQAQMQRVNQRMPKDKSQKSKCRRVLVR